MLSAFLASWVQGAVWLCIQQGQQCRVSWINRSHSTQNTLLQTGHIYTCGAQREMCRSAPSNNRLKSMHGMQTLHTDVEKGIITLLSFSSPWHAWQNLKWVNNDNYYSVQLTWVLLKCHKLTVPFPLDILQGHLLKGIHGEEVMKWSCQVRSWNQSQTCGERVPRGCHIPDRATQLQALLSQSDNCDPRTLLGECTVQGNRGSTAHYFHLNCELQQHINIISFITDFSLQFVIGALKLAYKIMWCNQSDHHLLVLY